MKSTLAVRFVRRRSRTILVRLVFAATVYYICCISDPTNPYSSLQSKIQSRPPADSTNQKKSEPELNEITVLTYSDRVTRGLCRSMVTAARHGFELGVLGVDEMSFSVFAGDPKMKKLFGMKALLSNETTLSKLGLHNSSTMLFADASDVVYLANLQEVSQRFHETLREHGERVVLVAAERNCWPYMVKDKERIPGGSSRCAEFPSKNSTFMYLNSGAYIGKVEAIKYMIASAYDRLSDAKDDQLALHELYAEQLRQTQNGAGRKPTFDIVLDRRALIFQTGWGTNLEGERYADRQRNGAYYDTLSGRVINTEHDTRPFLVHFNGGKNALQPVSAAVLAQELHQSDKQRINSILNIYRAKYDWFTRECASLDDIALFHKAVEGANVKDSYSNSIDTVGQMSSQKRVASSGTLGNASLPKRADLTKPIPKQNTIECPPGYPELHSRAEEGGQKVGCALQYFSKALSDARYLARGEVANVSLARMRRVVQRSPQQLGLYVLMKDESDGGAKWNHVSGQGINFWATKPFHHFMKRYSEVVASRLSPGQNVYFVVNGFDEPAVTGECPNMSQLTAIHPNIREGIVNRKEGVPVWSMSKVRDCHLDLLFPHPDLFAKFGRTAELRENQPWTQRKDEVVFRGSTTGMGSVDTNLRIKVARDLVNTSGFDVGIHAAIQTIKQDLITDLMKPTLQVSELSSYKYAMDIDGNAHSFNRPLAIARAGCTLLRVNVFTDLFDEGLLNGIHAFDIDPAKVKLDAPRLLRELRAAPDKAKAAATLLSETHAWLTEDVIMTYMKEAITQYSRSVRFID
jgi:hypothetical protein